jgi:hypothetical protein
MSNSKHSLKCRICNSSSLSTYLDLGNLPLANNIGLSSEEALNKEKFPLVVQFCNNCGLSQLSEIVDPNILFGHYVYRSGISQGYINHCRKMAKDFKDKYLFKNKYKNFVIDIAGNDCTLLEQFKQEIPNIEILNIDPAKNLCEICEEKQIPVINDFLSIRVALEVVEKYGKAKLITATNVIAHVENICEFIVSCKILLEEEGVLVLEFPYLIDYIENIEYDTTYHEHLSYISITPIHKLCTKLNMKIIDIEKQKIHGGTVRVSITNESSFYNKVKDSVMKFLNIEELQGYNNINKYTGWASSINTLIKDFSSNIIKLKEQGYKISGFAASAKGVTLLNSTGMSREYIDYIYDQTPEKIGKFSPGTGIPIISLTELIENNPDYLVILAWNFAEEIIEKVRKLGYKGKFIVPIPEWQII